MASTRADTHEEIHRRLGIPEPPECIANAVGVALSTVYRHRSGACQCVGSSRAARTRKRDIDIEAELKAMGFPTLEEQLEQVARVLGLPSYEEQMELLNQHLNNNVN